MPRPGRPRRALLSQVARAEPSPGFDAAETVAPSPTAEPTFSTRQYLQRRIPGTSGNTASDGTDGPAPPSPRLPPVHLQRNRTAALQPLGLYLHIPEVHEAHLLGHARRSRIVAVSPDGALMLTTLNIAIGRRPHELA